MMIITNCIIGFLSASLYFYPDWELRMSAYKDIYRDV